MRFDEATIEGHLTFPLDIDLATIGAARDATFASIEELVTGNVCGLFFPNVELSATQTHLEAQLSDGEGWHQEDDTLLRALAAHGTTGHLDVTCSTGTHRLVLGQGGVLTLPGQVYVPGDPDPDGQVVALTRDEALAVMLLVVGETPHNLDALIAKIRAAL